MTLDDIKANKKRFLIGAIIIVIASIMAIFAIKYIISSLSRFSDDSIDENNTTESIFFKLEPIAPNQLEDIETLSAEEQIRKKKYITANPSIKDKREISFSGQLLQKSFIDGTTTQKPKNVDNILDNKEPSRREANIPSYNNDISDEEIKTQIELIYNSDSNQNSNLNNQSKKDKTSIPIETEQDKLKAKKERYENGFNRASTSIANSNQGDEPTTQDYNKYIKCVVHGTQTLKASQVITLRLNESAITDNGITIARHTLIYGTVSFSENRAKIAITSVNINNNIFPFVRFVVALDGLPGIGLDQDNIKKETEKSVSDATNNQVQQALRRNTIGSLVGGITSDISNSIKREKSKEITLVDTYQLFISPIKK